MISIGFTNTCTIEDIQKAYPYLDMVDHDNRVKVVGTHIRGVGWGGGMGGIQKAYPYLDMVDHDNRVKVVGTHIRGVGWGWGAYRRPTPT